jgi:hypothetical protein
MADIISPFWIPFRRRASESFLTITIIVTWVNPFQFIPQSISPIPKMSSRPVVAKIDWNKLTSALSLTPQTTSSLTSFRKRNVDAHTKLNALRASRTQIDFSYYRSVLKNQAVVDQIERAAKQFKPATYDVGVILKGIDGFEAEAVKNAEDTEKKIAEQMVDLEETVKNIDQARHPDELSVCHF